MNSLLTLDKLVDNLKSKSEVDSVFITGSQGSEHKAYSDIDLVIIVNKHEHDLTSLYTWIEGKFADIFFFDHADLDRIKTSNNLPGNAMDGVFVSWLDKATIIFDKSQKLTELIAIREELGEKISIPQSEKDLFWQKINYNFVANRRYFNSGNSLYQEALEVRLLYSVSEVFTGYFEFRDIPWRGEKNAMKYLKENDSGFYNSFVSYTKSASLAEKFDAYSSMVKRVFPSGYRLWIEGDIVPQSKDRTKQNTAALIEYWQNLIRA